MSIEEYSTKHVITALESQTVFDTTKQMRDKNVGSVVVLDSEKRPIGMVTDRDIAVKIVAEGKDPKSTLLKAFMSQDMVVLSQEKGVFETTKIMSEKGFRRIPIVDSEGKLAGIVSSDDLIMVFGEEMVNIANAVAYETSHPERSKVPVG